MFYNVYTFKFANNGKDDDEFLVSGTHIQVMEITYPGANVAIKIDTIDKEKLYVKEGDVFKIPKGFERLYLSWDNTVTGQVTFVIGQDMEFYGSMPSVLDVVKNGQQQARTVDTSEGKIPSSTNFPDRHTVVLYNNSLQTVWLGIGTVTLGTGIPLKAGCYMSVKANDECDIYGIVSSGTSELRVWELR